MAHKQHSDQQGKGDFEQQYISLREKEQRVYTESQIARLPDIDPQHVHYKEWQVRKRSSDRLITHLAEKQRPLTILESGCGNGWLSARLAGIKNTTVTGIDVNETELQQARTVFAGRQNLGYQYGDIRDKKFDDQRYDTIVFAASVQYFPSLADILKRSLSLVHPGGAVHLIDTNFYSPAEATAAAERTRQYYTGMGFPEMSQYYHHHQLPDPEVFRYQILFDPRKLINRVLHRQDRFYWLKFPKA